MPHAIFQVTSINPNDNTGGGGCVCDPQRQRDCKPPFAVFPGNEMDSLASPHVVICKTCAEHVVKAFQGEILAAGEPASGPGVLTSSEPLQVMFQQYESILPVPTASSDVEDVPEV